MFHAPVRPPEPMRRRAFGEGETRREHRLRAHPQAHPARADRAPGIWTIAVDSGIAENGCDASAIQWLGFVVRKGFEHHVAMLRGSHAGAVQEATARTLKWPIHRHEAAAAEQAASSPIFRR